MQCTARRTESEARSGIRSLHDTTARDLLERFPAVHDGYDRLGMVYEAREQHREAAQCYRQVIENHPDDYELGFETTFQKLVDKLDPRTTA